MATTRLMPLHTGKGRSVGAAVSDILGYMENPNKTDGGRLVTSWMCSPQIAEAEFLLSKQIYKQKTDKKHGADDVIAYHLRQSFVPGEITPEEANRLGYELAKRFTKGDHAFVVCTHIDKKHVHNHIVWNSVNLTGNRKFRDFRRSAQAVRRLSDTICLENGYSVIAVPKGKSKSYDQWLSDKSISHRERIRLTIDAALAKKPESFEALLEFLRQAGYTVKGKNNPSLMGGAQQRGIRMDTLGKGYTPEDLRAVISGKKQHIPKKKYSRPASPAGNLLIDIQQKLQEGKGGGYAYWAKKFNLKQMAQTVAYLQEHGLTDYAELEKKAEEAARDVHALSQKMKSIEARMKELNALRTQIINYGKTREVYTAYRKAGYSKKFLAEHEAEIRQHKAAKKFFDGLGEEKLPTLREINAEYMELTAKKKTEYAEYREAREEMRSLLIAKENIDRLLHKPAVHEPAHRTER